MDYALVLAISDEAIQEFKTIDAARTYKEGFDEQGWKDIFPHLSKAPATYVGEWNDVSGWHPIKED